VLEKSGAGIVLAFNGENDISQVPVRFYDAFTAFRAFEENYNALGVDELIPCGTC